MSHKKRKIS